MPRSKIQRVGDIGLDVYRAAKGGEMDLAAGLLRKAARRGVAAFYEIDTYGGCPFSLWAQTGRTEIVDLLTPYGIAWTPWTAAAWGRVDELGATLEKEPGRLTESRWCGTPLHWAFAYGQTAVADWLITTYSIDLAATEGGGYVRCALSGGELHCCV